MKAPTFDPVSTAQVDDIAALDAATLCAWHEQAVGLLTSAMAINDKLDRALALKYARQVQALRLAAGEEAGVVHFDDDGIRITIELPLCVEWDQAKLADLFKRIAEVDDEPTKYVQVSYHVLEAEYAGWQEALRSQFAPARSVKAGQPAFRLELIGSGGVR